MYYFCYLCIVMKTNILLEIRKFIATIGWKLFIWGSGITEEDYWEAIYEQEKNYRENNTDEEV